MRNSADGWFAPEREKGHTRAADSFQEKRREQIADRPSQPSEPGTKRKTPLTDRIARTEAQSRAGRLETVPTFEILRRALVSEASVEHDEHAA